MNSKEVAHLKREPLDIAERAIDQEQVMKYWLKGQKGEAAISKISKDLSLSRAYVKKLIDECRDIYQNDESIRFRAREIVAEYDQTINDVKSEMYRLLEDAESEGDLKTRATVLKNIGDLDAKRLESLQKSGIMASLDLNDQIVEQEQKMQAVIQLLKDVVAKYPDLRAEVARRLSIINGKVEPITVVVQEQE